MIIQLPNGRIVECSLEQYLSLSDVEIKELNGLSSAYTKEVGDPFYSKFSSHIADGKVNPEIAESIMEHEPELYDIDTYEKLEDPYFHSDDV
tara:strand:+ start:1781 stop:2056 length:276 start_codon:yes stop_codon:yes gene_type:complete